MSTEINQLTQSLKQLRKLLESAYELAGIASSQATELSREFEQEISTDLDEFQVAIRIIADDLDSVLGETGTLTDDFEEMEISLRRGSDDVENYKTDSEHIQDEMREDKE